MSAKTRTGNRGPRSILLALTTAIGALLVSGCAMGWITGQPPATARAVQVALAQGKFDKAVLLAERVALASPRDAGRRAILGLAYLKAGRFASATTALADALELGDESAPTVLGLALAELGQGHNEAALELLDDWRDVIPVSDLGLGVALAGDPSRGIAVLTAAIRAGDRTPRTRQNLAYAYALAGHWREARLMMTHDLPADRIATRIGEWAQLSVPAANQARVAHLLGAPLTADPGQPRALALANLPAHEQQKAEVAVQAEPHAGG